MQLIEKLLNLYKDLPVRIKLMLFVICFSVWLAIIGAIGVWSAHSISEGLDKSTASLKRVALYNGLKNDFLYLRLDLVYSLVHTDRHPFDRALRDAEQRMKTITGGIDAMAQHKPDKEETELMRQFADGFKSYREQALKLMDKSKSAFASADGNARKEAARFAAEVVAPLYQEPGDAITQLVEHDTAASTSIRNQETENYHKHIKFIIAAAGVAVVLGLFFGLVIIRSIVSPLGKTLRAVKAVTDGDLTVTVPVEAHDDMGKLAEGINDMINQTGMVIAYLSLNSTRIAEAADQLYSNSLQIAAGSEQVAAQVNTVAVASEEMYATSSDIASNCQYASQRAERVNASATDGGKMVEGTTQIMAMIADQVRSTSQTVGNLGARSDRIGDIVDTIGDIADQTNLLALNAAIEAARAGEQGRGFAVVADEVRRLAERTTKATKEISTLIQGVQNETHAIVGAMRDGVVQVESGTTEANKSGDALREILEQIDELSSQVNTIATAAEEQSATTAEIAGNIQQVSQVINGSTRQSQQSTDTALNLTMLAKELHKLVNRFKVGSAENRAVASMARIDHKTFVERIAKAVSGEISFRSDSLPDHHTCRFGKWYYGEKGQGCNHLPAYRDIEGPHALIHEQAQQAVAAMERGARPEAEELLAKVQLTSKDIDRLLAELAEQTG